MCKKNSVLTYKEVYLQPESFKGINETLSSIFEVISKVFAEGNNYDELLFTGCGTSLYLAQTAAYIFSAYNETPAKAVPCSELFFSPEVYVKGKSILILPITRKSYTTEVRMAIDKVKTFKNVRTLAITCDEDSRLYNDDIIVSPDTYEDSVIMTRSFTSMVYLTTIMAMYVGGKKEEIEAMKEYDSYARELLKKMDTLSQTIIQENPDLNLFITLGQGVYYGVANECMNKIKEMGISNSEAYYSLEYRHGPMSLVDNHTLIVGLIGEKTASYESALLEQMRGYGGVTVAIGKGVNTTVSKANYYLDLETTLSDIQLAAVIGFIGQMLGYYIAEKKQINADTPRNLSQAIVLEK